MKANEAPEKIYVDTEDRLSDSILYGFTEKRKENDIEYTHTDAFIDKAHEWLRTNLSDYCDITREDFELFSDDFRKYLKEE